MMPEIVDKSVFDYGGKTMICLAPDNNHLCVANKNGLSKVLHTNSPEEEPEVVEIAQGITGIVCTSDTSYVLTTVQGDSYKYDFKKGTDQLLARSALPLRDCDVVHGGKMVVLGGDDLEIVLVELADDPKRHTLKIEEQVSQLSYSSQTNLLSVSMVNGKVSFFSLSSTRPNKLHEMNGYIPANSYNDTYRDEILNSLGTNLLSDDENDEDDGDENNVKDPEFCDENRISTRAAWHPRGLHFALPCGDYTVKVFTIKNYLLIKTLTNPAYSGAHYIDLKFDVLHGVYIAAVDLDNRLTVWDWETSDVIYKKEFQQKITNFVWKIQPDSEILDIILGTWSGDVITVKKVAEPQEGNSHEIPKRHGLFVESDNDEVSPYPTETLEAANEVFTDEENYNTKKHSYEDEENFIEDDDGAGYVSETRPLKQKKSVRNGSLPPSKASLSLAGSKPFVYKPLSQGATPFGSSDRRYLTMNNVGYVCVVRNNEQNSITVSFFDIGRFTEYHFEDLFGFDICSLNENGTLFGQSKTGHVHYRSHNSQHPSWTKILPLQKGEKLTSVSHTPKRVYAGTSSGYIRIFSQYGVPLMVEKMSPIVALAAQDYKLFSIHFHSSHGITYSLLERSPSSAKYYQRESPLPLTLPQENPQLSDNDSDFLYFNPLGIKNFFFSAYGDPCIFGIDNVLLVLSKWRSAAESRWLPVLDTNMEIWKTSGGKDSDVRAWPLGVIYDTLNCILVKGRNIWPEFPLPLPTELEMRIPIFVKSKLMEEQKDHINHGDELVEQEIVIPPQWAAEEEFLRSKVLSLLLGDTVANDGEIYGNEGEILDSLVGVHDKSLLRLFASACTEQNTEMALSLAQEVKQDRALNACLKIAERAELLNLSRKVSELREARIEQEINEGN